MVGEAIIQPSQSYKDYICIKLENGLSVLLVSDPVASDAAATMAVRVGSFSDLPLAPGLSHFLEHMVTASSHNDSQDFFHEHGGYTNAFTELEHSIFSMQIEPGSLQGALERFSQSFIALTWKSKSMESEINSVDSEFELKKRDDHWHLPQLRGHTSTEGHPFNRFVLGNKKTLSHSELNTSSLSQYAQSLFDKCFIGASMKLVVLGLETLDVLESWVSQYFCRIKQGSENVPKLNPTGSIWKADTMYHLEAIGI